MDERFKDNQRCFVCGPANPDGLRLVFRMDAERGEAEAEVAFPGRFQGWETVVHGGLLAAVLDEAMIKAARARDLRCVTGELSVRFSAPARIGEVYVLKGRLAGVRGKIVLAESEIVSRGGEAVARAKGKLFKISA